MYPLSGKNPLSIFWRAPKLNAMVDRCSDWKRMLLFIPFSLKDNSNHSWWSRIVHKKKNHHHHPCGLHVSRGRLAAAQKGRLLLLSKYSNFQWPTKRALLRNKSKLDQVNSANLLFELWSLVFYVLICYRIFRAEQLSWGTLLQGILSRGTLIYDGTGSI